MRLRELLRARRANRRYVWRCVDCNASSAYDRADTCPPLRCRYCGGRLDLFRERIH